MKKKIVFYCGFAPPIFLYKIARLFKKNNYETILFTMCEKDRFDLNFQKQAFDKIYHSDFEFSKTFLKNPKNIKNTLSLIKFLTKLKSVKPYAVIGLSNNNWQLKLIHNYFLKKIPFIYFPYDILSTFHLSKRDALKKGIKKFELNAEKYCLEKTDGIIHKGRPDELDFFKDKNINLTKHQLHFSTYSSKEFIVPINFNKLSKKDKEIHIGYAGFLVNDEESIKITTDRFNEILSQKIHLHLYVKVEHIPKSQADIYFNKLLGKFKKSKYFHIHPPLNPKEIIKELSKYDYALWLTVYLNLPDVNYHIGNKFASYLEAGVPMIYCKESIYVDNLMKHYNLQKLGFKNNFKELRKRIESLNYKEIINNTLKARDDFDMNKNFPRLEQFIKDVVNSKKSQV